MCFFAFETWTACQKPVNNLGHFLMEQTNMKLIYIISSWKLAFLHFVKRCVLPGNQGLKQRFVHWKRTYPGHTWTHTHTLTPNPLSAHYVPLTPLVKAIDSKILKVKLIGDFSNMSSVPNNDNNNPSVRFWEGPCTWGDRKKCLILFVLLAFSSS